jgi:hypothetical protein
MPFPPLPNQDYRLGTPEQRKALYEEIGLFSPMEKLRRQFAAQQDRIAELESNVEALIALVRDLQERVQ